MQILSNGDLTAGHQYTYRPTSEHEISKSSCFSVHMRQLASITMVQKCIQIHTLPQLSHSRGTVENLFFVPTTVLHIYSTNHSLFQNITFLFKHCSSEMYSIGFSYYYSVFFVCFFFFSLILLQQHANLSQLFTDSFTVKLVQQAQGKAKDVHTPWTKYSRGNRLNETLKHCVVTC